MNSSQQKLIEDTFTASNHGQIHFGKVIEQLVAANVESYCVDYRSYKTTYHLADDTTLILQMEPTEQNINALFTAAHIQAIIKAAQQGLIMYPEFKQRSMQAGCIGYTVWIAGRHVSYYGRKGESHVEHFPN